MKSWAKEYEDGDVKVNVGPRGEVGVWHGTTGNWTLTNVTAEGRVLQGRGKTMHEARAEVARQRP